MFTESTFFHITKLNRITRFLSVQTVSETQKKAFYIFICKDTVIMHRNEIVGFYGMYMYTKYGLPEPPNSDGSSLKSYPLNEKCPILAFI